MHGIIKHGTLISIGLSLLVTVLSMYDKSYPRFNEHEWWIFLWSFSPYAICSILFIRAVKISILTFIGSLVFLFSTIYLLLDSLYLHNDPKALLIYMFLPVIQFGVIGAYIILAIVGKLIAPNTWAKFARKHRGLGPR